MDPPLIDKDLNLEHKRYQDQEETLRFDFSDRFGVMEIFHPTARTALR